MSESSNQKLNSTESRRRWECGEGDFGQWTYEGDLKAFCKQVGVNGNLTRYPKAHMVVCEMSELSS